ncbi:MAG: mannose-6-phosphate isomerase, class I [Treponema sp.]|nr:mannose-6-phosphate isomerase, class I [Treponema sp.]MCL2271329.1 mannose-6-phosphate isomerase, class I [Treponema sp.]
MTKVIRLKNQIKNYEWGSQDLLPGFMGFENKKRLPYAELWMGTNKGAPSEACDKNIPLREICGDLPFLFKLLAVEKPLSIQAHPDKKQAEYGFRREEEAMLDLNAPIRNYRDSNHKPEILCALTPFILMAGFKKPEEIIESFDNLTLSIPQLREILSPLYQALKANLFQVFTRILYNLSGLELECITNFIGETRTEGETISSLQWELMKKFAVSNPREAAILSPLFLNLFTLQPGQAVFIPAGIMHCYISGFGVELMTNSDNVLRGGLTPKYIDIPELMSILKFEPYKPEIYTPDSLSDNRYYYRAPCSEFSLIRMRGGDAEFLERGHTVCIVTEGCLHIDEMTFKRGESFFIPKDTPGIFFSGDYTLFAAAAGTA